MKHWNKEVKKINYNDPEIFYYKKEEKPKRKSLRVHKKGSESSNGYGYSGKRLYAYCRRSNAAFFTENWEKVNCFYCKQQKETERLYEQEKKDRAEGRIESDYESFVKDLFEPYYNEDIYAYRERVRQAFRNRRDENDQEEKRIYADSIEWSDITVLPLDETNITFPFGFIDIHDINDYEGMYFNDTESVLLSKEQYIKLLMNTRDKIKEQLKKLLE